MSDSLRELLDTLNIDPDMLPEDFDPERLIGDISDKVDGIQWTLNDWLARASMIQIEYIKPFVEKQQSLLKKHERLKQYVKDQMIKHGMEKIPGKFKGFRLQATAPVVVFKQEPDAELYLKHSDVIKQNTAYKWDSKAIKEILQSGVEFPYAELKENKAVHEFIVDSKKDNKK